MSEEHKRAEVVHVPPADVTGLNSPRCEVCEYPLDHTCGRCGERLCITKHCQGPRSLGRHPKPCQP